jgi:hypothetical protein
MWPVEYLPAAGLERDKLPDRERVAVRNAVAKLQALGPDLPFPHAGDVRGVPRLRELRPRGGDCPWRPLYTREGDGFLIAAIGPDGESDQRGFARSCERALDRLAERKRDT